MLLRHCRLGKHVFGPAVAFISLTAGMYLYLATTNSPNQYWRNLPNARITVNEIFQTEARVYRHPDGKILIQLDNDWWYAYLPEMNNMYLCNRIRKVWFPGYIYAHNWDDHAIPCVNMGGAKGETKADLIIGRDSIEFTAEEHQRVRVVW
jgi:hypothetical protein